jgi:hypothetical protein
MFFRLMVLQRRDHAKMVVFYRPTEVHNEWGTFIGYEEGFDLTRREQFHEQLRPENIARVHRSCFPEPDID